MYTIANRVTLFFIKRNLNSKRGKTRTNDHECMHPQNETFTTSLKLPCSSKRGYHYENLFAKSKLCISIPLLLTKL